MMFPHRMPQDVNDLEKWQRNVSIMDSGCRIQCLNVSWTLPSC